MAKPTKTNVIRCKKIKGGRAGCWIKEKGKTVFRMTTLKRLSTLGIAITAGGKRLPGFAGKDKKGLSGSKRTKKKSGGRRTGCKTLKNGRRACYTAKGFRIVG